MSLIPYIKIARIDHWFKNIFMLPGIVLAYFFASHLLTADSWLRLLAAFVSTCLVASSNYVLNEILDVEKDKFHPEKQFRPIPMGQVKIPAAYAEWIILAVAGQGIGYFLCWQFGVVSSLLWIAGCLYNVRPIRLKEVPYADVISESLNNPLRLALGWYSTGITTLPPLSILMAYWSFGAFLMAMKRFAEYRQIGDPECAANYRHSFGYYNEERLIESIFFYGAFFGMLSGIFIMRYRVELVLATPIVAYSMAYYMHLGFKKNSSVQNPEHLYREKKLVILTVVSFVFCAILLMVDFPEFKQAIKPTEIEMLKQHPLEQISQ